MNTYTNEQVSAAINKAADEVIDEAGLDGSAVDAVALVVNAAMTYLDKPDGTLLDAVAHYSDEIIEEEEIEIDEGETADEAKARTKLHTILDWINTSY